MRFHEAVWFKKGSQGEWGAFFPILTVYAHIFLLIAQDVEV